MGFRAGLDVVKKIQILSPAGIQTPDRPVRSPATILPTLIILFSSLAQQPNVGQGRLILEGSRSHTMTHHSR